MAKDQTLKIIDMQSFIGGEADNPYMGPKNCCARAVGVDLRSKPGIAMLERDIREVKNVGNDYKILCVTNIQDLGANSDRQYMCYKVGNTSKLNIDNANEDTYTFNYQIGAMCINERNMYYIGKDWSGSSSLGIPSYKIYFYKSSLSSSGSPSNFELMNKTSEVYGKNGNIFAMNLNSKLYIASGNKVLTLDDVEVLQEELVLPEGETIVGMTEYLGTIKIYSVLGNDTYLYTWDGVDYLPTTRQCWKGTKVIGTGGNQRNGVLNDGAYDYILTESGDLYTVAGTQKQKIKASNKKDLNKKLLTLLKVEDGILYIGAEFLVYTYGIKYPGMDSILVGSYITPFYSGSSVDSYGPIFMCRDYIYTSYGSICILEASKLCNKEFRVDNIGMVRGGFIQTMYYTNDQWKNMSFEMMKMKVKTNRYCDVLIYYRTQINDNWILFKEIPWNYDDEKITISIREFNENNPGPFVGIQFMFILQQNEIFSNSEKTPEIGRITVFLREIDENI